MVEYLTLPATTSITDLRAARAAGWVVVVWDARYVLARHAGYSR